MLEYATFSTIFTTQMDWWQLIDFDNPDNEFRVVRNLYRSVSVSRITLRWKRYPQKALQNGGFVGHNHRSHYNYNLILYETVVTVSGFILTIIPSSSSYFIWERKLINLHSHGHNSLRLNKEHTSFQLQQRFALRNNCYATKKKKGIH